jgi:glucose-1-phosphate cytidylyltransferase
MKVVLFCGGLGTRIREHSETIPKPMVMIGYRPIIWHLMRYYAHFGHTEFILCLGYRGDLIKQYFLNYDESLSNDFELSVSGKNIRLFGRDIDGWKITFAETGLHSNIGQRLRAVQRYLGDDPEFLANYADGLSDLPLDEYVDHFRCQDKVASFVCVSPYPGTSQSFHVVSVAEDSLVRDIRPVSAAGLQINGGFFAFRRDIFDYMKDGEELVEEPFRRLISKRQLVGYIHKGFWAAMDTLKDMHIFNEMHARRETPWAVWDSSAAGSALAPGSSGTGGTDLIS